eukprot:TRINITY_DN2105_c0_g1_i1.p1 TRINITY_DN2105_c0_g1~~TRINITY_DN2105_c0_g1_i1.p1  ORF type:complete len:280 (-),score=16.86 TRINITY_DN2105_c0_g1_i1:152-991(-)
MPPTIPLTAEAVFHYVPSTALCIIAIIAFLIIVIVNTVQTIRVRYWLMLVLTLTAVLEFFGYIIRYSCINNITRNSFILTTLLLVIAPNFIALVNYVVIGTLAQRSSNIHKPRFLNAKTISFGFLMSDLLAFVLQGAAVYMITAADAQHNTLDSGLKLLKAGFIVQLGFFTIFLFLVVYVHQSPRLSFKGDPGTKPIFVVLYTTIVCLYLRSIYRLIEFLDNDSYITTHEPFYYIFDALCVFISFLIYCIYPVGKYMPPKQPNNRLFVSPEDGRELVKQ